MDLAVFLIIIVVVIIMLKDIKWVTYVIGISEIFLRLIHYIGDHLGISSFNSFVNKIFPESLFAIINKYTGGVIASILSWIIVIFLVWFLIYLFNSLFHQK